MLQTAFLHIWGLSNRLWAYCNGYQDVFTGTFSGKDSLIRYTAERRRSKKTVNGTETRYVWDGERLLSETKGNETIYYLYHGSSLVGLEYKGSEYYYEYNLQGDVAGIVNSSGQNVVRYTYSAWGKPESCTGNTELGEANPIRYRGYYYDAETGFYYLLSRYYDPDVGRFLNADNAILSTGESVQGYKSQY